MSELNELAVRYIAAWNEPDATARRKAIGQLFTEDAVHFSPSQEVHGHEAIAERIAGSYETWVQPGRYVFRSADNANGHHNAVRFNWEMVTVDGGAVGAVGFALVIVDADGRIRFDYQFIDLLSPDTRPSPSSINASAS